MSTSFFHNQNNMLSRRQFVTGVCAVAGAQLLPTGTLAMTSRAHRPFVDLQVEHARSIILEGRFDAGFVRDITRQDDGRADALG